MAKKAKKKPAAKKKKKPFRREEFRTSAHNSATWQTHFWLRSSWV